MKRIYFFTALFICLNLSAQDTLQNKTDKIRERSDEIANFYFTMPIGIGNNMLAKAFDPKFGLGTSVNTFSRHNFFILAGVEFAHFKVTDVSMVGNFTSANLGYLYGELKYKFIPLKNIALNPKIAIGYTWLTQYSSEKNYGDTDGVAYTAGFTVDYKLFMRVRIFAGLNYRYTVLKMDTDPEYESFYKNPQLLHIVAGIKF